MKRMTVVLLIVCCSVFSGCSMLPGEERAFPVCLGLHHADGTWQACVRISTYAKPGEYMTVSAAGSSLAEVMTLLDASAPIRLHYGQVRLVIFSHELAASDLLTAVLDSLNKLGEFRADAMLCVTEDDLASLMEEMKPASGTRLSKFLEVLLDSRIGQGVIPDTTLGDYRRQGERQSLTLIPIALADDGKSAQGMQTLPQNMPDGMKVQLAGAYLVSQEGRVTGQLNAYEHQLLRMMQGKLAKGALTTGEYSLTLLESSAEVRLNDKTALLTVRLRFRHSDQSEDGVREHVTKDVAGVIGKLAAANCDALGLGRQAILASRDWAEWRAIDWPHVYPALEWQVAVQAESA